ncbi:MAG: NFACT family protein, partial [Myxococcaceae bacterium]|nr:NFACT family protein [Myxococcaceae bacterium]
MGLNAAELDEVARELAAALPGAAVQKVHATPTTHTFLTLRRPQHTVVLCLCAVPQEARASILDERPTGRAEPGQASGFQQVLRRELVGARVTGCRASGLELSVDFERTGKARTVVLSLGRAVALLDPKGTVITAASAAQGVVLKPGTAFVPSTATPGAAASRLRGDGPLARARAAESLFTTLQAEATVSAARREVSQALKRLERTAAKVEADLARTAQAPRHRELGELLVRHAGQTRRGARSLEVQTYDAEGTLTRLTIALDPTRTPKEQADWHFHQYRRLTRGAELARARLERLREERAALEA